MARSERWIKLRLHVRHPRIIDLAELMGCSPAEALACAVDWFRQLDADAGGRTSYSAAAIDAAAGDHSGTTPFHLAARRLGWLCEDGNRLAADQPDEWFSRPAQLRVRRLSADQRTDGAQCALQSRAESDERRSEDRPGRRQASVRDRSTDTAGEPDGSTAQTMRRHLEISRLVAESQVAKNNAGRCINWLRNVIPQGDDFMRRIQRQAIDQGLFIGSPQHAMYVYASIRDEARTINGHSAATQQSAALPATEDEP